MSDRRTRQLERRQDRYLQRTEAPQQLRDKQLATAVWASIRAGKRSARTERVARRERQIVNLCVLYLYRDMILREFQSIRVEFSVCCASGERHGCHGRYAHTYEYTRTNVNLCEVILLHLCVFTYIVT